MRKKPPKAKKNTLQQIGYIDGFPCYIDKSSGVKASKRGGFTKDRIKNDPKMANVRHNYTEMSGVAKDVKAFKQLLFPMLHQFTDAKLHQSLMSLFHSLKKLDTTAERGMRCAGNGMLTIEGATLLRNYKFTVGRSLSNFLNHDMVFATLERFEIPNCSAKNFTLPPSVTHLHLQVGVLHLNPVSMEGDFCVSQTSLLSKDHVGTVTIDIPKPSKTYKLALPIVLAMGKCIHKETSMDLGGVTMEIRLKRNVG